MVGFVLTLKCFSLPLHFLFHRLLRASSRHRHIVTASASSTSRLARLASVRARVRQRGGGGNSNLLGQCEQIEGI